MGLVSTHQLSTFTTPVNGTSPIDANQVKGNDNSIKTSYNAHDADTTIHLQSGAVATRPAASTAGQTWLATDSGAVYLWLDNGSAWVEANYLRNTGGTVTGNVLITGTLGVTGATTLSSTLTIGGVTYTFPASQGANQYLKTDGSGNLSWVTFLETLALTDLSDVTITSVASGQFLLYNGTVWVNGTNGSALTTLNASNLSSGTVNTARVAGSYTGITAVGTLTAGAISTGFTAIADTFLATISTASKVSNSATTATNANTASAIVARDASGNFSAGTITASLTGNISGTAPAGTLTGTTLASNVTLSSLTSVGTLSAGAVPASLVTAGTFGAGAYTFPGALAITGALTGVTTLTASSTATIGAATSPLLLDRLADATNYGAMSFNGSLTSTTMNGLFGRLHATDGGLYIAAPSGSSTKVQVAGSTVATFAGALTTLATPLAITGAFTGATTGTFSGAASGRTLSLTQGSGAGIGVYVTPAAGGVFDLAGATATTWRFLDYTQSYVNFSIADTGAVAIRGTLAVTGAATFSSTLAVTGAATFSSSLTLSNNAGLTLITKGYFNSTYATGTLWAWGPGVLSTGNNFGFVGGGNNVIDFTSSAVNVYQAATFSGTLAVTGASTLTGGSTGTAALNSSYLVSDFINSTSGTGAHTTGQWTAGTTVSRLHTFSQGYSSSAPYMAASTQLLGTGTGGLSLYASAGPLTFYAGGTSASLTIASGGAATFSNDVTVTGYINGTQATTKGPYVGAGNAVTLTNGSTVLLTSATAGAAIVTVYESGSGSGGVFFVNYSGTVVKLAGDGDITDTGSTFAVYKSASSHTCTLKNRYGITRSFAIGVYSAAALN